jgi:ABC-type nitrate/sulfonate/bicarbonate transport system substrate-binding protein
MSRFTAFATALALALFGLPRPGAAADSVVLQLHGPVQFEFAGYYAALWKGFYRDAGLAVEIHPGGLSGKTPIDPVRELTEGHAQFGTGNAQLVIRTAQGLPLVLVAPIFQESGAAVYYRADSDFSSPAALMKAKLGRLPASDILDIELATALRTEGIDPARIKSVNIDASQIVPALADKTIDASIGSAWMVPWQAHERGIVLKSFNPANYRVEYYGDSLFTLRRYAADNPDMVAKFRAATLKGWEYALQHPDEIAGRLVSDPPSPPPVGDPIGFARYQIDVARRLARYPDIPLGYSNLDRWTQIEAGMLGAGILLRSADLTSFVYSPAAEPAPGESSDATGTILRFAALIAALGAAAWLGLRYWRGRAKEPAATPAAATVVEMPTPVEPPRVRTVSVRRARPAPEPPPLPEIPPPPPLPAPIDLNAILGPLERRIRQRVRGKVRFRFSLVPALWPCRTEGGPVAAIVLDLVSIATALMGDDGSLIVGTRNIAFDETSVYDYPGARIGEFARITVRDNGPALTEEEFARIFDPGVSVRPAIAAAAAAVERIGGFVRVETAEGIGTAVHLYFARVTQATIERLDGAPGPIAEVAE